MKALIFADSHRMTGGMERAILCEKPDLVFHLGDLETDALELERQFPSLRIYSVPGNCDMYTRSDPVIMPIVCGRTFFCAHGHTYHVKFGLSSIINAANAARADFLLFGHTHSALFEDQGHMVIINPGAVGYELSYGVLEFDREKYSYELRYVYDIPADK